MNSTEIKGSPLASLRLSGPLSATLYVGLPGPLWASLGLSGPLWFNGFMVQWRVQWFNGRFNGSMVIVGLFGPLSVMYWSRFSYRERPREAHRSPESLREAQRRTERPRESERGPGRPMYVCICMYACMYVCRVAQKSRAWREQGCPALGCLAAWLPG